ncbi:MAG: glycosyltransferase family 4 protein [Anaerolineae bacterium]|nr:glycosyltransferase family 4 protein [Anaerolineae bacterium]
MKVGVLNYRFDYYPYLRTILHQVPEVDYVPVWDVYSTLNRAANKLNRVMGRKLINTFDLNNQFMDGNRSPVDLLHFFNGISYGSTPWVSHFESSLPRLRELVTRHQGGQTEHKPLSAHARRALRALAGPACRQLIALSQCSAALQRDLLHEHAEFEAAVAPKMMVLHPPQAPQIDTIEDKPAPGERLRFMLVGAAFFRKGGREILLSFEKMVRQYHYPLELILVTSMRIEDYAAKETPADVAWALEKIDANQDWITHHRSLPNAGVLALMKSADVGLLPSYADTYGYSVLEFQSCGCPVITSDVRALPEMNPPDAGWLIEVPKNPLGEALYTTAEGRERISHALTGGLERVLHEIAANPQLVRRKGAAALEHLRRQHDPARYASALRTVYENALG